MINIVIIKLGALGDVVRTLAILPIIKEKYPESNITWVTKQESKEILEDNIYVDNVTEIPNEIKESFDILYNLDIEDEATRLAEEIKAKRKYGFYSVDGFPSAFNIMAEYYINTIFDDELKKSNRKTYQEMMCEALDLKWEKQHCPIFLNEKDKAYAEIFAKNNNLVGKKILGIHMGASPRWPSKAWHKHELEEFIKLVRQRGLEILLFGGPKESEELSSLVNKLKQQGVKVYQNDPNNTIKQFASLVNLCSVIVCADSLALHVSLALKKPTIGLFFCTSPWEIEDYGLLKKISSPRLLEFFPERMNEYNEELTKSITAQEVIKELEEMLNKKS